MKSEKRSILAFWRAVEYLSLHDPAEIQHNGAPAKAAVELIVQKVRHESEESATQRNIKPSGNFLLADLTRIEKAAAANDLGKALLSYLSIPDPNRRVDLRKNQASLQSALSPSHIPEARWPAGDDSPLPLAQQAAVNLIRKTLAAESGIFSVSSATGYERSMILRDLIAAAIVDRAKILSRLASPLDAFSEVSGADCVAISSELLGTGIAVVSSAKGIESPRDGHWRGKLNFLSGISRAVFDSPSSLKSIAASLIPLLDFPLLGVPLLDGAASGAPRDSWQNAIERFRSALDEFERLNEPSLLCSHSLPKLVRLRSDIARLNNEIDDLVSRRKEVAERKKILDTRLESFMDRKDFFAERAAEIHAVRPSPFHRIFVRETYRAWKHALLPLEAEVARISTEISGMQAEIVSVERRRKETQRRLLNAQRELEARYTEWETARAQAEKVRALLGENFPDAGFWHRSDAEKQILSPWMFDRLNKARTEVFTAAEDLHRAFLTAAAEPLKKNLARLSSILSHEQHGAELPHLLGAVFLACPVASTSFASFNSLFAAMGRESLGWLFVDESEPIPPQAPVGAIWRSKRAVLIGNSHPCGEPGRTTAPPVRIPPVVIEELRASFRVSEKWDPAHHSAQAVADRANQFGTFVRNGGGEPLWVGVPLWSQEPTSGISPAEREDTEPRRSARNRIRAI